MDRAIVEKTITNILTEIHLRLDKTARIAEAYALAAVSPKA